MSRACEVKPATKVEPISFIPLAKAAERLGKKCVKTIKRMIQRGQLPKPVVCGGELAFVTAEFEAVAAKMVADRDSDLTKFRRRRMRPLEQWREHGSEVGHVGTGNVDQASA